MSTTQTEQEIRTLNVTREIQIAAPIEVVFESVLEELGPGSQMPDGTPFPMKIEARPRGRWYRDLGNESGHLWGHVQVIKPPALLELSGPLFMSYPGQNFVQYRLTKENGGTLLKLTHQAMGLIPDDVMEGVQEGWQHGLNRVREIAERKAKQR
jgi:uncharacterized protein YndB with AHSA1/START domain